MGSDPGARDFVFMNGTSWNRSVQVKSYRQRLDVVQIVIILRLVHIRKLYRIINIRQALVLRS
jgi:hypothetical protein